jgi:hypothetical protein
MYDPVDLMLNDLYNCLNRTLYTLLFIFFHFRKTIKSTESYIQNIIL